MALVLIALTGCTDERRYLEERDDALNQYFGACLALSEVIDRYPWMAPRILGDSDEAIEMMSDIDHDLHSAGQMGWPEYSVYELLISTTERGGHTLRCDRSIYESES